MADDPNPRPGEDEDELDEIDDPGEGDDEAGEADGGEDGASGDAAGEEDDDAADPAADDDGGGAEEEPDESRERRPAARGVPDRGQRDARRSREARLERELEELRQRVNGGDPDAAARNYEAEENRKLNAAQEAETMGQVGAVARYWHERTVRETRGTTQFMANQSFEREDARDFRSLCRDVPAFARIKDWVEENIAAARRRGDFRLTREAVAKFRIGELALERSRSGRERQRERGERRVERQTVRPGRGGSDAVRPRGRRSEADLSAEEFEQSFGNIPLTR